LAVVGGLFPRLVLAGLSLWSNIHPLTRLSQSFTFFRQLSQLNRQTLSAKSGRHGFIDFPQVFELYRLGIVAVTSLLQLRILLSTYTSIRPNSGNSFCDAVSNHLDVAILPEVQPVVY